MEQIDGGVQVEQLDLDSNNPRLPEELQGKPQYEILAYLEENDVLDELADSFLSNRYFESEPILVLPAKVLYQGNATDAVRAVLGQLYTYRYFLYSDILPRLVGLFSEPIGDAYAAFLDECGIASVWKGGGHWMGSPTARTYDLAD
jgi:hypothetical protein